MSAQYLNLRIGAARRLAILRLAADNWNKEHPHAPLQNPTWREMRFGNFTYPRGLSQGFNDKQPVWVTHDGPAFGREQFADEVEGIRIGHQGWFTDREFQDATCRGIVVALPHGRFIAGYYSSNHGERVYFPELYSDAKEAARGADHLAEKYAEQECEYQERYRAAQDLQDKIDERQARLAECLALRNDARPCFTGLRDEARECIEAIRLARATLANEFKGVL